MRDNEGPQYKATIEKPCAVGKFEVTRDEWQACVAAKGSDEHPMSTVGSDQGWGAGKLPVVIVSWQATEACLAVDGNRRPRRTVAGGLGMTGLRVTSEARPLLLCVKNISCPSGRTVDLIESCVYSSAHSRGSL